MNCARENAHSFTLLRQIAGWKAWIDDMKTQLLGSLFLSILFFSTVRADDNSAALDKLRSIPAAPDNVVLDQSKKAPLVFLTVRGAFINNSKTPVPFDQVLKTLADLPKSAWPYGRAIVYFPFPPGLSIERAPDPRIARKVEADLKEAGISFLPAISV